jgi:3-hydroxyacyl-[acyl-carrier-protein] dehydratase
VIHQSYETAEIHALIAHRFPMLLVDRIDVLEPGQHVIGVKTLSASEWWAEAVDGAFPFALVIEALAQTSGGLIDGLTDSAEGTVAYFMAANRVRFRNTAYAGDRLTLDITLRQWRRGVCRTRGIASVGSGSIVATAELVTIVRASG